MEKLYKNSLQEPQRGGLATPGRFQALCFEYCAHGGRRPDMGLAKPPTSEVSDSEN